MAKLVMLIIISAVVTSACRPAAMIPPPEIKPLQQVDSQSQEARQHILTASYFQSKGELTKMAFHLDQAWVRTKDPQIWLLWGDLLLRSNKPEEATQKWKEGLEIIPPSDTSTRQALWRRINSIQSNNERAHETEIKTNTKTSGEAHNKTQNKEQKP